MKKVLAMALIGTMIMGGTMVAHADSVKIGVSVADSQIRSISTSSTE